MALKILIIGRGYIGSYLDVYLRKSKNISVTTVDHSRSADIKTRYQNLDVDFLKRYECILWFAGHSSVPQASVDPVGTVENNILGLFNLANKLSKDQTVIYASSASIYSSDNQSSVPSSENDVKLNPLNIYDSSKISFDALASFLSPKFVGLRLSTLTGYSEYFRRELIVNSMVSSAKDHQIVQIGNKEAYRSILYLDDLAKFIEKIILTGTYLDLPSFINLATHSGKIDDIGLEIAKFFGASVEYIPDSSTYSFALDCTVAKDFKFKVTKFSKVISQLSKDLD